jgi:Clp amino terminal domain, pathogenicity island component
MFGGDHPSLRRALGQAVASARSLGHPRAGSEHLLLALSASGGQVAAVLGRHGANPAAVLDAVEKAAPLGAGAAADRAALAPLGVDVDRLLAGLSPAAIDRPAAREPRLPLGTAAARRRCAAISPPLGLDGQAAYEASLRLALARRDRQHRIEHLALALVALDPGVQWILSAAGARTSALFADLAATFPPPRRNIVLRTERRVARRSRYRHLVTRYQQTAGRIAASAPAVAALIAH